MDDLQFIGILGTIFGAIFTVLSLLCLCISFIFLLIAKAMHYNKATDFFRLLFNFFAYATLLSIMTLLIGFAACALPNV